MDIKYLTPFFHISFFLNPSRSHHGTFHLLIHIVELQGLCHVDLPPVAWADPQASQRKTAISWEPGVPPKTWVGVQIDGRQAGESECKDRDMKDKPFTLLTDGAGSGRGAAGRRSQALHCLSTPQAGSARAPGGPARTSILPVGSHGNKRLNP